MIIAVEDSLEEFLKEYKMSSYPVLNNRPIDQWKVTELKEELKRRKLITRGLKDDLIRRLDEALQIERENAEEEEAEEENHVDNGIESHPSNRSMAGNSETAVSGCVTESDQIDKNDEKADGARVSIDINESLVLPNQSIPVDGTATVGGARTVEALTAPETIVESSIEITTAETSTDGKGNAAMEIALTEQGEQHPEKEGNGMSDNQLEDEDLKGQVESENIRMPPEKTILASVAPNYQVSEVSSNLGFQVKSDSINNDPVSINEKNEFADNIKLELDVVKLEMVEPSSSNAVPVGGESHPMDVKGLHESKVAVEEKEDKNNSTNANMNRNSEIADLGDAEKLNLDQRASDDSMEEDVREGKNIDSKQHDCKGSNKEKTEATAVMEESPVDIIGDVDEKDIKAENSQQSTLAEKRKLNDGSVGNNELLKRQRKWKAEGIKVPEPQGSNLVSTTTPRDTFQTPTSRRNFSRSDSTASDDVPKERVVPPPQKPPTNSLRIDQFLRPFTLKAVQELLGKTGTVKIFWMDHIKTHCYVTYSSVEEAVETRNAVYNLQWPPNGGRRLIAEFVEPEEVKARLEAPPQASAPVPAAQSSQPPPRQQAAPPKRQLPPPPPFAPPVAQERDQGVPLPPPPPLPEKSDPTIITLDVLFRKTKATPRIYYLPLSEEQVAAKLSARGKALRQ